jgi:hypothetical protein
VSDPALTPPHREMVIEVKGSDRSGERDVQCGADQSDLHLAGIACTHSALSHGAVVAMATKASRP